MRHDIVLNDDGIYWCETENVNANECEDDTRCSNQCVCNPKRYKVTYEQYFWADNEDHALEQAMDDPSLFVIDEADDD